MRRKKLLEITLCAVLMIGALLCCMQDASARETLLISGNADLYPIESYDRGRECYVGLLPELYERLSEQTGYDLVYLPYSKNTTQAQHVARQFFCETRTEFLRKNSPVLRSKSETRSLASTAPKMEGAAHVKGRVLAWGGAAFAAPPLAFCPWGSSYPSVASPASSAASWAATGSVYSDQP